MKKAVLIIFVLILCISIIYAFEYMWKPGRQILNPACRDYLLMNAEKNGLLFDSIKHSVNDSTATYYFTASVKNLDNEIKKLEYEFYACRCKEHLGNSVGVCLGYWPSINYTYGSPWDHKKYCLGLGKINETFLPYEQKNISANYSQYRNKLCGMFQVDLHAFKVNDAYYPEWVEGLVAAGLVDLCEDCEEHYCGDGILDEGEECDDGNLINGDGCDNNCKTEINGFCEQFGCWDCFLADWKNNENVKYPHDCTVVIIAKEGKYYPKCYPTTCAD